MNLVLAKWISGTACVVTRPFTDVDTTVLLDFPQPAAPTPDAANAATTTAMPVRRTKPPDRYPVAGIGGGATPSGAATGSETGGCCVCGSVPFDDRAFLAAMAPKAIAG